MAYDLRKAPGRRNRTGLVRPIQLVVVHLEEDGFEIGSETSRRLFGHLDGDLHDRYWKMW